MQAAGLAEPDRWSVELRLKAGVVPLLSSDDLYGYVLDRESVYLVPLDSKPPDRLTGSESGGYPKQRRYLLNWEYLQTFAVVFLFVTGLFFDVVLALGRYYHTQPQKPRASSAAEGEAEEERQSSPAHNHRERS